MRRQEIPMAPFTKGELYIERRGIVPQFTVKVYEAKTFSLLQKGAGAILYLCGTQPIFWRLLYSTNYFPLNCKQGFRLANCNSKSLDTSAVPLELSLTYVDSHLIFKNHGR